MTERIVLRELRPHFIFVLIMTYLIQVQSSRGLENVDIIIALLGFIVVIYYFRKSLLASYDGKRLYLRDIPDIEQPTRLYRTGSLLVVCFGETSEKSVDCLFCSPGQIKRFIRDCKIGETPESEVKQLDEE